MQSGLGIEVLAGEAEVDSADAVLRDVSVEGGVAGLPHDGLAAVGGQLRSAEVVVVQVGDLVVSDHCDRLAAVVEVAGPLVVGVLGQQLVEPRIHVAAGRAGLALAHALIQCVHGVGGRGAGSGVAGEASEGIIAQRVGLACRVGERGDVAVGVGGVAARLAAGGRLQQAVAG